MVALLGLANELLLCIFEYLSNRDLKSCRLACKQLEPLVTRRLFRRIHLAANLASLKNFESVYQHVSFRGFVREIVYDASYYDYYLARNHGYYEPHADLLRYGPDHLRGNIRFQYEDSGSESRVVEGFYEIRDAKGQFQSYPLKTLAVKGEQIYQQRYNEQYYVMCSGKLSSCLVKGFASLPNVKKITICDGIMQDDGNTCSVPEYTVESNGMPVLGRKDWLNCPNTHETENAEHQADGFFAVLNALAVTNNTIQDLCIRPAHQISGIPYTTAELLLRPGPRLVHLQKGVANLRRLEIRLQLRCDMEEDDEDSEMDTEEGDEDFYMENLALDSLCSLLHAAQELRVLVLCLSAWSVPHHVAFGRRLEFRDEVWPHLTELELGCMTIRGSDLTSFVRRHSSTLRKLKLDDIRLTSAETNWASIIEQIRDILAPNGGRVDCGVVY